MILNLIVRLTKKIQLYKMSYFREPYTHSKNKIEGELDLSYHATKNTAGVNTSKSAKQANLASLKLETLISWYLLLLI